MKRNLLLLALLSLAKPAFAQHTELLGHAGLGLFQFAGKSAVSSSFINYSSYNGTEQGYTNSPYGSRLGTGFVLGGRLQRVSRRQWLGALDVSYEWLRSRTAITGLNYSSSSSGTYSNANYAADGTTYLRTQNVMVFLGLGRRFGLSALSLDALVGPELVGIFNARERGSGTYQNGTAWKTDTERNTGLPIDARLRADVTAWYQRVGVNASYSYGFANYQNGLVPGGLEVYARVLRLGLAYRLK